MAEDGYLCQGFLTKSPPEHKMNRARWQRRWFVLSVSEDRVTLDYFKDSSRSKLKGTIPLRECQRVDQGLSFESKRRYQNAHIFDVVTPKRKYYLVTNTETDMQRWVDSICRACGFRSEDESSSVSDTTSYRFQLERASIVSEDNGRGGFGRLPSMSGSVRSEPGEIVQDSAAESYIPLTNCATKADSDMSQSLPRDFEAEFLGRASRASSSSGSSSSSIPDAASMSEPVRMLDRPTVAPGNEVYDVPPVKPSLLQSIYENHRTSTVKDPLSSRFEQEMSQVQEEMRKDSGDELECRTLPARNLGPQSNYDFVPPPRRPSMEPEMESVYDVPPVKQQLVKPMVPERTYPASCIYDIPSALTNDESIYDIPPGPMPVEPPPGLDNAFVSKPLPASDSTDELAKSLEQISMRNAEKNFAEEQTQDSIYDVPPVLRKENPFSPSRPPVSSPKNAPPRPPKPPNLEGPPLDRGPLNPPTDFADEGFDDTYVGSPGVNETSRLSNGHSAAGHQPAPQGHHWLNHTVPTPRKYLNVRDSSSSKPSSVPTSHPHPMPSPTGYLLMQGPNSPSNVFQYPDENYMTMEGSPEQAKRGPELYTAMNGNQPPPLPRMSTTSPVAVFSEEREEKEIFPPPVDRSSKPGRPKTGSSTTSIGSTKLASDSRGLSDSYYATDPDLGIPTRNSRTKSFSREGRHRSTNSPRGTPTMIRSNTVQYPSGSKPSLTHQSASVGEFSSSDIGDMSQDTYMLHENFIGERQSPDLSSNFPSSPRMKDKDKIEYLEIAHDEESATSPPPSKPSKDNNVEYITIDSEKTKALETIQQNREKSYKGS